MLRVWNRSKIPTWHVKTMCNQDFSWGKCEWPATDNFQKQCNFFFRKSNQMICYDSGIHLVILVCTATGSTSYMLDHWTTEVTCSPPSCPLALIGTLIYAGILCRLWNRKHISRLITYSSSRQFPFHLEPLWIRPYSSCWDGMFTGRPLATWTSGYLACYLLWWGLHTWNSPCL